MVKCQDYEEQPHISARLLLFFCDITQLLSVFNPLFSENDHPYKCFYIAFLLAVVKNYSVYKEIRRVFKLHKDLVNRVLCKSFIFPRILTRGVWKNGLKLKLLWFIVCLIISTFKILTCVTCICLTTIQKICLMMKQILKSWKNKCTCFMIIDSRFYYKSLVTFKA